MEEDGAIPHPTLHIRLYMLMLAAAFHVGHRNLPRVTAKRVVREETRAHAEADDLARRAARAGACGEAVAHEAAAVGGTSGAGLSDRAHRQGRGAGWTGGAAMTDGGRLRV